MYLFVPWGNVHILRQQKVGVIVRHLFLVRPKKSQFFDDIIYGRSSCFFYSTRSVKNSKVGKPKENSCSALVPVFLKDPIAK